MSTDDESTDRPGADGEDEDFARMLEESIEAESFEEGQTVEGRIVSLARDVAFIDVGGKGEAAIDIEELLDPDGALDVEVGDIVQAVVVSTSGGLKLSTRLARGAASRKQLGEAYRAGLPVEGRVERVIKGGYEVRVGGQRAFCPISQIDSSFTADPEVHAGQLYTFRITEYKEDGKNLVVSRRALLEEAERAQAAEVRRSLVPGAVVPGRVASLQPYGAFVDLGGGIQGLLHVSEMSWSRIADPGQVVRPGETLEVKVLRVDDDKGKISLGLKQLLPDPWSTVADTYAAGQVLRGKVTRVADFGAFVELEPGVEALAHASSFPPTGKRDAWKAAAPPGADVAVEILGVDLARKRIQVALLDEGSVRAREAGGAAPIAAGARLTGKVQRHEAYGVFVFLAPGRTALMPAAESGVERGTDLRRAFPVGSDVEVVVLEADPSGSRIRVSCRAVDAADERRDAREFADRQERQQTDGFGSLADKLRNAIRRPKE